jgi:hypothetical protein
MTAGSARRGSGRRRRRHLPGGAHGDQRRDHRQRAPNRRPCRPAAPHFHSHFLPGGLEPRRPGAASWEEKRLTAAKFARRPDGEPDLFPKSCSPLTFVLHSEGHPRRERAAARRREGRPTRSSWLILCRAEGGGGLRTAWVELSAGVALRSGAPGGGCATATSSRPCCRGGTQPRPRFDR